MLSLLRKNQSPAPRPQDATEPFEPPAPLETAVLFLVFNRPDTTAQVFEAIRKAKPPRLYIAADGPRADRPGDAEKVAKVREIATAVDWPCEVKTLFREENLGCKYAVSGGITWFFEQEEQGIILEDDCLPSQSFFWFCQDLLDKYSGDIRVWQICGSSIISPTHLDGFESYFFSKYGPIWGWASWRRAWAEYDAELRKWPQMKRSTSFSSIYPDARERKGRTSLGDKLYAGMIDTWDFQWGFAKNYQSGLSVIPASNMVLNIGFHEDATHTRTGTPPNRKKHELPFPLNHPNFIFADALHDQKYLRRAWGTTRLRRYFRKLRRLL